MPDVTDYENDRYARRKVSSAVTASWPPKPPLCLDLFGPSAAQVATAIDPRRSQRPLIPYTARQREEMHARLNVLARLHVANARSLPPRVLGQPATPALKGELLCLIKQFRGDLEPRRSDDDDRRTTGAAAEDESCAAWVDDVVTALVFRAKREAAAATAVEVDASLPRREELAKALIAWERGLNTHYDAFQRHAAEACQHHHHNVHVLRDAECYNLRTTAVSSSESPDVDDEEDGRPPMIRRSRTESRSQ
jgi:hypothetical protein